MRQILRFNEICVQTVPLWLGRHRFRKHCCLAAWECLRGDGSTRLPTAESTKPIAKTGTHAGVVKVKRLAFEMP